MHWKHRSANRAVACCSLIVLLCCVGVAQQPPRSATADIPFDFYVSGTKMPAGAYTLEVVAPTFVTLRSQDGKQQQSLYFLQTAVPGKKIENKIIFNLRDGKYYFAQVWSWYGKAQLTSFTPKSTDQTKDVPLKPVEKDMAKPAGSL